MDKLSSALNDTVIGGHIGGQLLNHLCYADDMCLISISSSGMHCIVLYCIMRPYTDGPIGPLSYRHSSGVVRNPH